MSVCAAGTPAKLTRVRLRRHAGGKDWHGLCCRRLLFSYRNGVAGSTGGYVAGISAAWENLKIHCYNEQSNIKIAISYQSFFCVCCVILIKQGHPTSIFGKYLFGKRFEIENFRNICCKISCLPASKKWYNCLFLTCFYPKKVTYNFRGLFSGWNFRR